MGAHCEDHRNYATACQACRKINREDMKRRRKPRLKRVYGPDEIRHGSMGFRNWHCQCPVCLAAGELDALRKAERIVRPDWPMMAGPRGVVMADVILAEIRLIGGE